MENKVLQKNIAQIAHYDNELANRILMFKIEKSNLELAQNENGEYNLLFYNKPLHSAQGAIKEANMVAKNFQDNQDEIKIIYGLGLGYLADVTSNIIKKNKIIIYEPNLELIKYVLSIAQIDALYKENVILCNDKDTFYNHIKNFSDENTTFSISFLNSYKIYLEDIKDILYLAQKAQGENIGNVNTYLSKAHGQFYSTLLNFVDIIKNPNISDLVDIYKGKTALIACAGPSLKQNIDIIKKNQNKFVIFALNTTAKLLIENGIEPDFIVAIENYAPLEHFKNVDTQKYYFIEEAALNPEVKKLKTKKTFNFISKNNFLNDYIRECLKLDDEIYSFGTVSYTALESAYIMGFDRIILVGQNLAYDGARCYSTDCHIVDVECIYDEKEKKYKIVADEEKYMNSGIAKKFGQEAAKIVLKTHLENMNKNICTVKSQEGIDILSKTDYAIFIKCFEDAAKKIKAKKPNIKLINSSNKGAQINGFENVKLEDAVNLLEDVEKLNLDEYKPNIDKKYLVKKIDELIDKNHLFHLQINKIIENKKKFDENSMNIDEFFNEYYEIIENIVKLKEKHKYNYLEFFYLLQLKKDYNLKTLLDIEKTKENIDKIMNVAGLFNYRAIVFKDFLCNCKSFVLQ